MEVLELTVQGDEAWRPSLLQPLIEVAASLAPVLFWGVVDKICHDSGNRDRPLQAHHLPRKS